MSEKTPGYILLFLGLFVMVIAFVYVLLVFTGNRQPVQVFSIPAPTIDMASMLTSTLPQGASLTIPKNEIEVLPAEDFNKILNMSITFFLMGFVLTFGFRLASLGVQFLRPVKITVKDTNNQPVPNA